MRLLLRLASVWNTLFRRERLDRDLDDEIRATVETLVSRFVGDGMAPEPARRAALSALGGPGGIVQVRENVRDGRLGAGLEAVLVDLRYAWRSLSKARGLTAVIVATLALAIGANTAIFSVVRAMLIAPLPYRDADQLAFIWLNKSDSGYPRSPMSGPDFCDLRDRTRRFAALAGIWATGTVSLAADGPAEQLRGARVTTNFFDVLGATPALGRTFVPGDSDPGAAATVLLGWDLFTRRFRGDASILGRRVLIDDQPATVVGVMPASFRLLLPQDSSVPDRLQIWQPFWPDFDHNPRGHYFLRVVGRMQPGVTIDEARADVDAVAERITSDAGVDRRFTTVALQADGVREIRGPVLALFAGVVILMVIACVNVASVLIARAVSRAREMSVRVALGAGRGRLLRQSLIEGLVLTGLGGAAGVVVGTLALQLLVALAPESLSRLSAARIDAIVLAFTLIVSIVWGVLLSLAAAAEMFKSAPLRYRVRATLIVLQIAASVVLLVGAGLLARAFVQVQHVDPGFRSERRVAFRVALPESRYTFDAQVEATREMQRRIAAIPGVADVGAISHPPYDDLPNWYMTYALERPSHDGGEKADSRVVTPRLMEALGVELVEGRFFAEHENPKDSIVIVDEMLARRLWPGQTAIGRVFLVGQGEPDWRVTVVGVIRHLRLRSLVEDLTPQVYIPYQHWQRTPMTYIVRSDRDPAALAADFRAAVASVDSRLPISEVTPLERSVESARATRRFTMQLAAAFAASAVVLTCLGVFGVLAYAVAARRRELGVRRALGADARQVMREIWCEGMAFAIAGSVGGLAAASLAAGFLRSQLYAVHPRDPLTYAAALALVLAGAALASWIPAQRATSISALDAIRE